MANSFIRVPAGYEGPSEFQVASRNTIDRESQKYLKDINRSNYGCHCGNPQCYGAFKPSEIPAFHPLRTHEIPPFGTLQPQRPHTSLAPTGRPKEPLQPRREGHMPNIATLVDFSSAPDVNSVNRNDLSKPPANIADTYQPASSLSKRQSASDEEYDEDSGLEEDLALMRVSTRRPAGTTLESNLEVKEALDVLEDSKAEKALVEKSTNGSGKHPKLTLPTRGKVMSSDAKENPIKKGEGGKKKAKKMNRDIHPRRMIGIFQEPNEVEMQAPARPRSEAKPPAVAKQPTQATTLIKPTPPVPARVVIPMTDDEAAEEESKGTNVETSI